MSTTIKIAQVVDWKVVGPLAAAVLAILQAAQYVGVRLRSAKSFRNRGGSLGKFFLLCYELPQYLHLAFLFLVALAGLAALWGFVVGALDAYELIHIGPFNSFMWQFYERFGVPIVVVWFLGAVVTQFNLLPRLLVWFAGIVWSTLPSSLVAAKDFAELNEKAQPLVPRPVGIKSVADEVMRKLESGLDFDKNRAKEPADTPADVKANVLLLGCMIERHLRTHNRDEKRSWAPFYHCLAVAQENGGSIFSKDFILAFRPTAESFLDLLRRMSNACLSGFGEPQIPDSAALAGEIGRAIEVLQAKYDGTAYNLAKRRWPFKGFSMDLAWKRGQALPLLDESGMLPQCLKLMLVWRVWPDIKPKSFIYPYASTIPGYLLDSGAIIVHDDMKTVEMKDEGRRAVVREVVQQVSSYVARYLQSTASPKYGQMLEQLKASTTLPLEWEIAYRVDFCIWSISYEKSKADAFKNWRITTGDTVSRK